MCLFSIEQKITIDGSLLSETQAWTIRQALLALQAQIEQAEKDGVEGIVLVTLRESCKQIIPLLDEKPN